MNRQKSLLPFAALAVAVGFVLWLLRSSGDARITWLTATAAEFELDAPSRLIAFRIAADANGGRYCAPLRVDSGTDQERLSFAHSLPAGTMVVSFRDVADATEFRSSVVSTVLVDAADEAAVARLDAVAETMEMARRAIEERRGGWLTEAEFGVFLRGDRGGSVLTVPVEPMFTIGDWQANGFVGRVVAP